MPKHILTILTILSLSLFSMGGANADWLDKLKDTAKELTDKAGQAIKEAAPEAPSTSDGEGQTSKPATTAAPSKPAAPETQTVTKPAAPKAAQPAPVANTGNSNKTLVRNIQQELKRLGYSIGVDGAYGPNTKKQIIAFEQSQSLEPSGDASVELLAKLKETPTPKAAEPAATTTTTAAPAPAPKAPEPKVVETKAAEPKVEKAAAPKPKIEKAAAPTKSLNPHDYDQLTPYQGEQVGRWQLIKNSSPNRFFAEIEGNELFTQWDLREMKIPSGTDIKIRDLVRIDFKKTNNYDPPSVVLIRFNGTVITAKNVANGSSNIIQFYAKNDDVPKLLAHVQNGGNFEFRADKFEPLEYSEEWTTFSSPPPEIAAAKQAAKDKQAAAQAAYQAEQDKIAAYAETLSPESKIVYEQCEQSNSARTYYSCQCIAQNIGTHVDKTAASQREEAEKLFIYHYGEDGKRAFENIDKLNLTAEQKAERKKAVQKRMDEDKQHMAMLQNKAAWDDRTRRQIVQTASIWAYKEKTCKIGEGWRENEYSACMKTSNLSNLKGKTPEEYCSCSADKVAELWTSSDQSYGSNVAVNLPVKARFDCRK